MFDGMPEQFYQFLAAANTTSRATAPTNIAVATSPAALSLPLSFSLLQSHHHAVAAAAAFPTTYTPPPSTQPIFDAPYHHLYHHHHSQFVTRNGVKEDDDEETLNSPTAQLPTNLQDGGDAQRSSSLMLLPEIPWSNDEVLALFRIRSSLDNTWFPDFIWENVSRKLAEIGFKRSAEKCKEKFEVETRCFSNSIVSSSNNCNNKKTATHTPSNNNNNYGLFGELEELCNNTSNIDHGSVKHRIICPPPDQSDRPQTSLSQGNLCQDEDNEDDDHENPAEVEADVTEGEGVGNDGEGEDNTRNDNNAEEDEPSVGDSEKTEEISKRVMRKRKRQKKFEIFKEFCEKIVNKMMAQQEQLHCKILQDMVKRDEEKIAKEEAWKKQEFERLEKVLEVRAHEQAVSGDRQAKILDSLKKFSASSNSLEGHQSLKEALEKLKKVSKITSSDSSILSQDSTISAQLQPSSSCTTHAHSHRNPKVTNIPMSSSSSDQAPKNPNPILSQNDPSELPSLVSSRKFSRLDHTSTSVAEHIIDFKAPENQSGLKSNTGYGKDDTGRRWPRDEVLALINIRCSLFNNGGDTHQEREGYNKGPLWERISQKMMELGYKRSAKRCKEKWENINKYFRKTKDLNKKRSIDSRTCPYYHQLSHLYSQGTPMGTTDRPMNLPRSPENRSMELTRQSQGHGSSTPATNNGMHTSQGNEARVVQEARFDFKF